MSIGGQVDIPGLYRYQGEKVVPIHSVDTAGGQGGDCAQCRDTKEIMEALLVGIETPR